MAEAIRRSQQESLNSETELSEKEFQEALKASLTHQDLLDSQTKKEEAELEHAIALSLALEAEQLRATALEQSEEQSRLDALEAAKRSEMARSQEKKPEEIKVDKENIKSESQAIKSVKTLPPLKNLKNVRLNFRFVFGCLYFTSPFLIPV